MTTHDIINDIICPIVAFIAVFHAYRLFTDICESITKIENRLDKLESSDKNDKMD